MPTPEEEKIIVCGAEINYQNAKAMYAAAKSTLEMDNLFRQTVADPPREAVIYFDQVKRRATRIMELSKEIMELASGFSSTGSTEQDDADLPDSPAAGP